LEEAADPSLDKLRHNDALYEGPSRMLWYVRTLRKDVAASNTVD